MSKKALLSIPAGGEFRVWVCLDCRLLVAATGVTAKDANCPACNAAMVRAWDGVASAMLKLPRTKRRPRLALVKS